MKSTPSFPALLGCRFFWGEFTFRYSLVLKALCWILQRFIFLLWRWKSNARNHRRSLLFFGVASPVKSASSRPALLGCRFFRGEFAFRYSLVLRALCWILQRFIFLLWRWKSNARNHRRSLHFAGVSQLTDEFNPVGLFVRNQFAGLKMKVHVSHKAVVKWKNILVKSSCWLCSSVVVSLP